MAEQGVDDSQMTGVSNIAKSAKQYIQVRIELERIFVQNPQIDTVLLVVSPFTVMPTNGDKSYYDDSFLDYMSFYSPFFKIEDFFDLPKSAILFQNLVDGKCLQYLFKRVRPGCFFKSNRDKLKEGVAFEDKQKNGELKIWGNTTTLNYLQQVIDLCEQNKVKLIFFAPPMWHFEERYDAVGFRSVVNRIIAGTNVDFWDFSCVDFADSLYGDNTHLNYKGAIEFTKIINKKLGH